ncbi:MAG: SprT family zinc-dependent metalloprotease [Rhodospirillales bacterium]
MDIDGRVVPITIRRHPRARNLILRIEPMIGPIVTVPWHTPFQEAIDLVKRKAVWLLRQLDAEPVTVPFVDGARVPLLGIERAIRHDPDGRRPVVVTEDEFRVSGRAEHMARRLKDWFRIEARRAIGARVEDKTALLGRPYRRITIRDTRSRWGSCTEDGCLSFSWRLIMLPEPVLDYIVAHEVAHLKDLDHSPSFWRTVAELTAEVDRARAWLKVYGDRVFYYG